MAAVWGQMTTGLGHSQLQESMSVIGIPVMTKASFIDTERDIGGWWKEDLQQSMAEAGQEEKRIAEKNGSFSACYLLFLLMEDGRNALTSTPTMPNLVWQ